MAAWWHWVVSLDATGRAMLPAAVWRRVAGWTCASAVSRGDALVLRDGVGAPARVDRRGRLTLPAWLRSACGAGGSVLVAARRPDAAVIAVSPAHVLDALVGDLVGEVG